MVNPLGRPSSIGPGMPSIPGGAQNANLEMGKMVEGLEKLAAEKTASTKKPIGDVANKLRETGVASGILSVLSPDSQKDPTVLLGSAIALAILSQKSKE